MPITQSIIVHDLVQADGRRAIRERHVWDDGRVEFVSYLAAEDTDVNVHLAEQVPILEARDAATASLPRPEAVFTADEAAAVFAAQTKLDAVEVEKFKAALVSAKKTTKEISEVIS